MIPKEIVELLQPIDFKSIWELGNKKTRAGYLYRNYYESLGIKYDCIDWNGKDGAIKLNLNEIQILEHREMVTNFGVTEHINNQRAAFTNIHNFSDSRIVNWVPAFGSKNMKHGFYRYKEEFFELLAHLNRYIVLKWYTIEQSNKLTILCTSFLKQNNNSFIWSDELDEYIVRIR